MTNTDLPHNRTSNRPWLPFALRLLLYMAIVAALPLSWLCRTPPVPASLPARDPESETLRQHFSQLLGGKQPQHKPPTLSQAEAEEVVDRLIGMGFLTFVAEPQRATIRSQLVQSATQRHLDSEWDDNGVSADRRGYPADNEKLAEGQVGAAIVLMKPVLEMEGVKLESVLDDFSDERYQVEINGKPHLIYDRNAVEPGKTAGVALTRLLEIVSKLLEQAGSNERLYGSYSGNDGRVILLTPEQHAYFRSLAGVLDYRWMPYPAGEVEDRFNSGTK